MTDAADLTIAAAQARIRAGRLPAGEPVRAALERIERREPQVNAWIAVDDGGALAAAAGAGDGPLAGIPLAVKDIVHVAGLPTTAGAAGWVRRPRSDAPSVARLRAAGAAILGKAHTNEFAYGIDGRNPHHGDCRNPHDPDRITGGSTSGPAAAVAAGMALGGLGTDTGGSLRTPASLCGVVGLRPSPGLVPRAGVVPLAPSYDRVGPIARTCADAALLLSVLAGRDMEPALPAAGGRAAVGRPLAGLRVGVVEELVEGRCEPYVAGGLRAALGVLGELGAQVVEARVPHLLHAEGVQLAVQMAEAAAVHLPWFDEQAPRYAADVRDRLETGRLLPASAYLTARRAGDVLRAGFAEAMDAQRLDVLAAPATPVVAPRRDAEEVEVAGRTVPLRRALLDLTLPLTQSGGPVLCLPAGRHDGLPFGMQLAARAGADALVLGVGAAFEAASA